MFADDTEIDTTEKPEYHQDIQNNLNADLHKLKDYLNYNRLSLNIQKCEFMLIGTFQSLSKMPDIHVHIDNKPLNQVTVATYLGMFIDSNIKWNDHINKLVSKFSAKIGILRILRKTVPIQTLKQMYTVIVQPHFGYGDMVYESASGTNKIRLRKLQTRAARLITGSDPRASRVSTLKELAARLTIFTIQKRFP